MNTVAIPMEQLAQLLQVQLEKGTASLVVTGSSMYPLFRSHKDTAFLRKPSCPLKRKDIILYRRDNGQFVLHRIISVKGRNMLICSGDNQYIREEVPAENVVAVVTGFERAGKTYSVDYMGYRLYCTLWVWLFPVRRPILMLRRLLGTLRRKWRTRNI